MAQELAVAALVRKRAELAGRIDHARLALQELIAQLGALDATICLFDPTMKPAVIRAKLYRPEARVPLPELTTRGVLTLFRQAEGPLTARELATRYLSERAMGDDPKAVTEAANRISEILRRQARQGVLERVGSPGVVGRWRIREDEGEMTA
jgi:hypothetical protein